MNRNDRKFLADVISALENAKHDKCWRTVTNVICSIEWALKAVPKEK